MPRTHDTLPVVTEQDRERMRKLGAWKNGLPSVSTPPPRTLKEVFDASRRLQRMSRGGVREDDAAVRQHVRFREQSVATSHPIPKPFPLTRAMIDKSLAEFLDGLFGRDPGWSVVGAHAANVYRREPRFTMDIDLLVALGAQSMQDAAAAFTEEGWTVRTIDPEGWLLRVSHPGYGHLDVIASETPYQDEALRRARIVDLDDGVSARVLSPEDVIIHKLIADRAKDDADIEDILQTEPSLDWDYLNKWFDAWELRQRFERIAARMRHDN